MTASLPVAKGMGVTHVVSSHVKKTCSRAEGTIAFFAAAILLTSAVLWADQPSTNERTDFSVTYTASRMVYVGLSPKLYDLREQYRVKSSLLPCAEPLIYEHPPFEALLLAPLGAQPYKIAYLIWGLINAAIWLTLPFILRPYAPLPCDDLAYAGLWISFVPLGVTLFQGQSSLVVLLLFSLSFIQWKKGHDFWAGVLLGLGLFKFQFILPFVAVFLLLRKWRFVLGFMGSAVTLAVLSLIAVGWSGIRDYIHLLTHASIALDNRFYGSSLDMPTIAAFVHATLGRVLNNATIALIASAMSAALILWTARWWRKVDSAGRDARSNLMFAATIVVSLVTGTHMFIHDMSPLLLAVLLVAPDLRSHDHTLWTTILRTAVFLFWIPPLYFVLLASHLGYLWLPVLITFLAGVVALANGREHVPGCVACD